jgi:hypothetical protein
MVIRSSTFGETTLPGERITAEIENPLARLVVREPTACGLLGKVLAVETQ